MVFPCPTAPIQIHGIPKSECQIQTCYFSPIAWKRGQSFLWLYFVILAASHFKANLLQTGKFKQMIWLKTARYSKNTEVTFSAMSNLSLYPVVFNFPLYSFPSYADLLTLLWAEVHALCTPWGLGIQGTPQGPIRKLTQLPQSFCTSAQFSPWKNSGQLYLC